MNAGTSAWADECWDLSAGMGSSLRLQAPLRWRKPRHAVMVSPDLYQGSHDDSVIASAYAVMALAVDHTFLVRTAHARRQRELMSSPRFWTEVRRRADELTAGRAGNLVADPDHPLPNAWLGVLVEGSGEAHNRVSTLLSTPAARRFVACEPLVQPVRLCACDGAAYASQTAPFLIDSDCPVHGATRLDWVVCGGEAGPGARPLHPAWVRALRDDCRAAGVRFTFTGWGEYRPTPIADAPHLASGRGYLTHDGARVAAVIRERGPSGTFRAATTRPLRPGDRIRSGICLDRDVMALRVGASRSGRELDGQIWDQRPADVGVPR